MCPESRKRQHERGRGRSKSGSGQRGIGDPGKTLAVNPNSGLSGIMESVRQALAEVGLGLSETDHVELCDENGKLLNSNDFPPMLWLSSFLKPESEEVYFVPVRVERDGKQLLKLEPLLTEAEKSEPEMMLKMKKENHIARERRAPKTEAVRNTANEDVVQVTPGSAHPSKGGKAQHQKSLR